jgi:integrase/recombinase XerD
MRFEDAGRMLRQFSRVMGNPDIDKVTPEAVANFLHGDGNLSATWMLKYRVLKGLYRFALGRGYVCDLPLPKIFPKLPPQQTPYV